MNILNFLDSLKSLSSSKSEWREERPPPESPAMRMIREQAQDQGMTVDDFVRYYQSPEYTSEYDQHNLECQCRGNSLKLTRQSLKLVGKKC